MGALGRNLNCTPRTVLCCAEDAYGHTIPALSLALALQSRGNEIYWMTFGNRMSPLLQKYGITPTPLSAKLMERTSVIRSKLHAYKPEVTICDFSLPLWWALTVWQPRCRVSILRCELLLGYQRRNVFLPDKFLLDHRQTLENTNDNLRKLGLPLVRDQRELFRGEVIAVPSVPQIDPLPEGVQDAYPGTTFVYTGPLFLPSTAPISDSLHEWLGRRRSEGTPIILVTLGTAWGGSIYKLLVDCLAQTDFATVMVIPDEADRVPLEVRNGSRMQVIGFTDLQDLAGQVDIVIHHAGHATLQAVLLAGKPSITLPSGEYDREDNALRLEALGCGRHLGHDFFRKGLSSDALAGAIREVSLDNSVKEGVAIMSKVIKEYRTRGVTDFLRIVEQPVSS